MHIAREIGEYERMSTVAANAYVQPIVSSYLAKLRMDAGPERGRRATHHAVERRVQPQIASDAPIRILESAQGGVLSVNCARVKHQ